MSSFNIQVGDNQYEMEFTRDSVRKFERSGGSLKTLQDQIQTTADSLFAIGIMTNNPQINPNLAEKICNEALDEYGLDEVYATVVVPFMEVFTQAGNKPAGKTLRLVPKAEKATKA